MAKIIKNKNNMNKIIRREDELRREHVENVYIEKYVEEYRDRYPKKNKEQLEEYIKSNHKAKLDNIIGKLKMAGEGTSKKIEANNRTVNISSPSRHQNKSKRSYPEKINEIYGGARKGFYEYIDAFDVHTNKTQTPSDLIKSVIALDKEMHYNPSKVKNFNSIENMKKAAEKLKSGDTFIALDLEIMGATNEHGFKSFNGITEFAINTYKKDGKAAKMIPEKSYHNIIGLDGSSTEGKRLKDKYIKMIEKASNGTKLSTEEGVMSTYLAKLGHQDTNIIKTAPGKYEIESFATDKSSNLLSKSNMDKGLKKYLDIGVEQKVSLDPNGLMTWENQLIDAFKMLNTTDNAVVGSNITPADLPWMNQMVTKFRPEAQEVLKEAIGNDMFVHIKEENIADMLAMSKVYGAEHTKSAIHAYSKDGRKNLGKGKTAFQQESTVHTYLKDMLNNAPAHNAVTDTNMVANLASGDYFDEIYKVINNVDQTPMRRELKFGNQQLFIPTTGINGIEGSFRKNELTGSFHLNTGKSIGSLGVSDELVGEFGLKADAAYTLDSILEINPNEKFIKGMGGVHNTLGQNKLFGVKMRSYSSNPGVHQGAQSTHMLLFNSMEEAIAMFDSTILAGEKNKNGVFGFINDYHKDFMESNFAEINYGQNGKITNTTFEGMSSIFKSTDRRMKEDAADRAARALDYTKTDKFENLFKAVKRDFKPGSKITAEDVNKTIQQAIANHKAQNKIFDIRLSYEDIKNSLGWKDLDSGEQKLITNTLDNVTTNMDIMMDPNQRKVSSEIRKHIDTLGNLSNEEKNNKYKEIFEGLTSQAEGKLEGKSKEEIDRLIKGTAGSVHKKDVMNHFEVDLSTIFKLKDNGKIITNAMADSDTSNILRIDLRNNKEYSSVDNLIKKVLGNDSRVKNNKDLHGIGIIERMVEGLKSDERYAEGLKDFVYKEDGKHIHGSANSFMEDFIFHLKKMKEKDINTGIITPVKKYGLKGSAVFDLIVNDDDFTKNVKDITNNLQKNVSIDLKKGSNNLTQHIDKMVQSTMMPNKEGFIKNLKDRGLNEVGLKYQEKLYDETKGDLVRGYNNIVDNLLKTGATLQYDPDSRSIMAIATDGSVEDIKLMEVINQDGVLHLQVGKSKKALNLRMDGTSDKARIHTNINKVFNETYKFESNYENASNSSEGLSVVKTQIKELRKGLREGPTLTTMNRKQSNSSQLFDHSMVMDFAKQMHDKGELEGVAWRDPEAMKRLLEKDGLSFATSSGTDRSVMQKNIGIVLDKIGQKNSDIREIAKVMSRDVHENDTVAFKGWIGNVTTSVGDGYVASGRPPKFQRGNLEQFRESDLAKAILKSDKGPSMDIGERFLHEKEFKSRQILNSNLSERTETIIKMKQASISDGEYTGLILSKRSELSKKGALDKRAEKVINRMMRSGTHEDSFVIMPSVADIYENAAKQSINAQNKIAIDVAENFKVIENMQELASIMPSLEIVNDGEFVLKLAKNGRDIKRGDKIISLLAYGDESAESIASKIDNGYLSFNIAHKKGNIKATEEELNSYIKNFMDQKKISTPGYSPETTDIFNELKDAFNMSIQVESTDKMGRVKVSPSIAEKGMAQTMYGGLGEFDEDVYSFLKQSGKGDLTGRTLRDEHFDRLVMKNFDQQNEKLGIFKSKEEFLSRVHKEQYELEDYYKEMLGHNVGLIGNPGEMSHGNFFTGVQGSINTMIDMEVEKGLSQEDATAKVFNKLQGGDNRAFNSDSVRVDGKHIVFGDDVRGGVDNINISKIRNIAKDDYGLSYDLNGKEYVGQDLRDSSGRIIGALTSSEVGIMEDIKNVAGSQNVLESDNYNALRKQLKYATSDYERQMIKDKMAEQKSMFIGDRGINTTLKLKDREMGILMGEKKDNAIINNFNRAIDDGSLSASKVRNIIGSISDETSENGHRVIKESVRKESLLKGYKEALYSGMMYKEGDYLLSDAIKDNADKYGHLEPILAIQDKFDRKVSLNAAENMYSNSKGLQAIDWNANKGSSSLSYQDMLDKGFKAMNLEDIHMPIGNDASYVANEGKSFLTEDMMVKVGGLFEGDKEEYIAIPAFDRRAGEQVIKFDYQNKLGALQEAAFNVQEADESSRTQAINNYNSMKEKVTKGLRADITGKKGTFMDAAAIELDQTTYNKATNFINFNRLEDSKYLSDNVVSHLKEYGIKASNWGALSDAKFDGVTLVDHLEKNIQLPVAFQGRSSFENMGFFSESYRGKFAEAYKDNADYKDIIKDGMISEENMEDVLRRDGVSAIITRHPAIRESALSPGKLYLSDDVKTGEMTLLSSLGKALGADSDGDNIAATVIKNKDGLDSILAQDKGTVFEEVNMQIYGTGIGKGRHYNQKVLDKRLGDLNKPFSSTDLETLTKGEAIEGKIYANFNIAPSVEGIQGHLKDYEHLEEVIRSGGFVNEGAEIGPETITSFLDSMQDNNPLKDSYRDTAVFNYKFIQSEKAEIAKGGKGVVGELNIPLLNIRKYGSIAYNTTDDFTEYDTNIIQSFADLIENDAISSKKGSYHLEVEKATEISSALNNLVRSTPLNVEERKQDMENVFRHIDEDKLKEQMGILKGKGFTEVLEADGETLISTTKFKEDYIETLIGFDASKIRELDQATRIGVANSGVYGKALLEIDSGLTSSEYGKMMTSVDMAEAANMKNIIDESMKSRLINDDTLTLVDGREWLRDEASTGQTVRNMLGSTHEAVSSIMKNVSGKNLAMGAIGIAAATMVAGYVGGNPSKPADTHAQEEFNDSFYDMPMLEDHQGDIPQQGQQQGYVVNINASTKKDIRRAQSMIQNAVQNSIPTDVNISMNVNNRGGSITDKYIQDLISGAF